MPRLSAVEAINPAIELTRAMLGRPFRFKTWLKVGFIGTMAGAGTFGYFSPSGNVPGSSQGGAAAVDIVQSVENFFRDHLLLILIMAALGLIICIVFLYLSCRFRFILFETVLTREAQIQRGWRRYRPQSNRYFGFMISFMVVTGVMLALVVGLPLWRAWKSGAWLNDEPMVLIVRYVVPIGLGIVLVVMVVLAALMLANDFLVPLMAVEDLNIGSAWKQLKSLAWSEPWPFAAYLGLKPVLAFAAGIALGLIMLLGFLVLLIFVVAILVLFKAGWTGIGVGTLVAGLGILVAIVVGVLLTLMTSAPLAVFMTAYSLYFLGGRYPPLGEILWPQPSSPIAPPVVSPIAPPPPIPGPAPTS